VSCGKILLTHCEKEIYIYDQNTFGMTAKWVETDKNKHREIDAQKEHVSLQSNLFKHMEVSV
jgi:hypothetical protein